MTTDKSAKALIAKYNIRNSDLKRYVRKLKKDNNKEIFEEVESLQNPIDPIDPTDQPEGIVLADTETFSIEKLMAETLEENYGVTSLDLLSNKSSL